MQADRTDALVDMTHRWYEATDKLNTYVRVVLLHFSKAFDLITHHILLEKLQTNDIPACIERWIAAFLLDRLQRVKIGTDWSFSGSSNRGVPQGTLSRPKCFLLYVNDLEIHVLLYKYVDDSTLFEICSGEDDSVRLSNGQHRMKCESTLNNQVMVISPRPSPSYQ